MRNTEHKMRNRTYGGVRGRKTKVGRKPLRFPPTRLFLYGTNGNLLPTGNRSHNLNIQEKSRKNQTLSPIFHWSHSPNYIG